MSITSTDVQYIADLARIHVPMNEVEKFAKNLTDIVKYVGQLQTLNVDNVKPTSHTVPIGNVLRPDSIKLSLTNAEALAFAIETKEGAFKVPLVIE